MKSVFYILVLFLPVGNLFAQDVTVKGSVQPSICDVGHPGNQAEEIFTLVEQMPEFPGGSEALHAFIKNNLMYPSRAVKAGIGGKCYLKFVILEAGEICRVEVLKDVPGCPECDSEAVRVIKSMPRWNPGKQNGRPVKVFYTLPISFVNANTGSK